MREESDLRMGDVPYGVHVVELDDRSPYLREMRRRAETPEDSDIIMELDLPEPLSHPIMGDETAGLPI